MMSTTPPNLSDLNTADVWDAAHTALLTRRWTEARLALDELLTRDDNRDELSTGYTLPSYPLCVVLADRIEAVNRLARRGEADCA